MGRPPSGGGPVFRFLPTEVADMEKALEDTKGATPVREVMEALANTFSASPGRAGRVSISSKQVWNWFQNRRHQVKKGAKQSEKQNTTATNSDTPVSKRTLSTSTAIPSGTNITEPIKMEFEAKSSRDKAWYDVQSFLAHRMLDSGDPEVKVRFAGFGEEDDEWVNVRSGVRQRSVPCETIECVAVLPGDLILCFQEGNEQALYFDAYIKDVERRRHDVRGCRCRFLVQYVHDGIKEIVPLRKVCRRPETEYRLQAKQPKVTGNTPVESKDTIYSMDGNVSTQGNILRVELGDPASGIPRPSATEFNFRLDVGDGVHKEEPKKASLVEMQSPRPGQSSQIVELN